MNIDNFLCNSTLVKIEILADNNLGTMLCLCYIFSVADLIL